MSGQPDTSAEAVEGLAALLDRMAESGYCAGPPICRWTAAALRALAVERNAAVAARDEAIREMSRQARAAEAMEAERDHLRAVMREARSLIDRHMGDTDPQDPDHPLLRACQTLSAALGDAP